MNKIRIRLKAYDHVLLDKSSEKIVQTAKDTGALVLGPIPIPTKKSVYTVNRSVHVDKKSREQFQVKIHIRIIDLLNSSTKTVDSLMKLDLPAGVDIELRYMLWDFLKKENKKGKTILLTTHYIEEAEKLCDEIAIINQGQIITNGKTNEIITEMGQNHIQFTLNNLDAVSYTHLTLPTKRIV